MGQVFQDHPPPSQFADLIQSDVGKGQCQHRHEDGQRQPELVLLLHRLVAFFNHLGQAVRCTERQVMDRGAQGVQARQAIQQEGSCGLDRGLCAQALVCRRDEAVDFQHRALVIGVVADQALGAAGVQQMHAADPDVVTQSQIGWGRLKLRGRGHAPEFTQSQVLDLDLVNVEQSEVVACPDRLLEQRKLAGLHQGHAEQGNQQPQPDQAQPAESGRALLDGRHATSIVRSCHAERL